MPVKHKCKKCGKCCIAESGPFIFPSDIMIICNYLKIKPKDFVSQFCTHNYIHTSKKDYDIYTLKLKNKRCIFLHNKLCSIHPVKPYQCKFAPFEFLGKYEYWEHMVCVNEKDFSNIDTTVNDEKMFSQIINEEYDIILWRK